MTMTKNQILIGLGTFVGLLLIIVLGRALMVSRPDVPAPAAKIDVNANMVAQHLASVLIRIGVRVDFQIEFDDFSSLTRARFTALRKHVR